MRSMTDNSAHYFSLWKYTEPQYDHFAVNSTSPSFYELKVTLPHKDL